MFRRPLESLRWFALGLALTQTGCLSVASVAVETFDENISIVRDENCKLAHLLFGKAYCQSKRRTLEANPLYCFQTLGGVDCHAVPDPYLTAIPGRVIPAQAVGASVPVEAPAAPVQAPSSDMAQGRPAPSVAAEWRWAGTPIPEADRAPTAIDLRPTHRTHRELP